MGESIPIQTGFYQSASSPLVNRRLINMFSLVPASPAYFEMSLFGTPGVVEFLDTALDSPCRGAIEAGDIAYFVISNSFIEVASNGTFINRGSISGLTSTISMAYNGKTIALVDPSGSSYFYTVETNDLSQITDPVFLEFGQVKTVEYKQDFFVFTADLEWFNSSSVATNNGQDFDALDFGTENIDPDKITKSFTSHNQLYIMGQRTTALYQNIATTGFPFARISGANFQVGCSAPASVITFVNNFAFIGAGLNERPGFWMVSDSTPVKISTPGIENVIHRYDDDTIAEAVGDVYALGGNHFARWTIGENTLIYDHTTSSALGVPTWHEGQTGVTGGLTFKRQRWQHLIKVYGKLLVGDSETGKIGELDPDHFFEFGDPIERVCQTQPFGSGNPVFSSEVELFIEAGVGNSDVPDPEWAFSYSDDGTRSFSNPIPRKMGKVGEYKRQLVWRRMGRFPNDRVLKWTTTDPVKIAILGATAEAE